MRQFKRHALHCLPWLADLCATHIPLLCQTIFMSQAAYSIRHMQLHDIEQVLTVQASAYPPALLEDAAFFINRLALAADSCWVATGISDTELLGYLVSYPWDSSLPPALNAALQQLPHTQSHWFLHDCAVSGQAQGLGVGRALYEHAAVNAKNQGIQTGALVALGSAVTYWQRLGYQAQPINHQSSMAAKLKQYGEGARYMTRPFTE